MSSIPQYQNFAKMFYITDAPLHTVLHPTKAGKKQQTTKNFNPAFISHLAHIYNTIYNNE